MNPGKVAVSILCAAAAVAAIGAMRTTAAARTAAAVALARAEDTRRRDADVAFFVRRVAADPMGAADRSRLAALRSEEHTSELQSRGHLVCRLLLEKKR